MKKFLRTLMLAALMLPFVSNAQTMYLTVADSTATNNYVPVYGNYMDDPLGCQSIYPASMLTEMIGENILSLHYYVSAGGSASWGQNKPMLVKMMVVTESDLSAGYIDVTNATTVYNGTISQGDATVADGFTVDFTTPFMYTGGNLLISFQINPDDVGGFSSITWYGKAITAASRSGYGSANYDFSTTGVVRNFLPKTTFMYGAAPTCFKVTGQAIDATQTTANSLTFTWTDALNTNATYSIYDMSDTTLIQSGITAMTYTVNNLTPNTAYSFGIQTDCGGGDIANGYAIVNGRTACAAISLPYSCGFEAEEILATTPNVDAFPFCWTRYASGSGSYTYFPYSYSSSTYSNSGSRTLYFYDGTSASYPDTMVAILPELDVNTYPMNANRLTFWGRVSSGTNVKNVQIGTMTNPADMSTFVSVANVEVSGTTQTLYSVPLSNASSTAPYVAIMLVKSSTGYLCIDDVTLEEMPSCIEITGLAASNITSNSVTLTWADNVNSNATYSIYNSIDGTIIQSGITDTIYTVTGLDANTQYTLGVQANCTSGDASIMTIVITTACANETMPWTENFDNWESKSQCWSFMSGAYNLGAGTPSTSTSAWALNTTYGNFIAISGKALTMNVYSTNRYWAVTPMIDITSDDAVLSVDVAVSAWSSAAANYDDNDTLAFAISTDGGTTFTNLMALDNTQLNALSANYTTINVPVVGYNNQTVRFAIFSGSSASGGDNRIAIDNVYVGEAPDCPNVNGLSLDGQTASTANVSWNDNGATDYEVEVLQNGDPLSTVTVVVTDTTAVISGLAVDNDYQVIVRSVCGSNYGQWTSPLNIHIGYCTPSPSSVDGSGIASVAFGGMTNTTSHSGSSAAYINNTTMAGTVPAGTAATVDITYATGYTYGTVIWVDWDNSMSFDGNEVVYVGTSENTNPTTLTATFDIPATQALGNYRMRIVGADSYFDSYTASIEAAATANPCASYSWGVAEDYTLTVTEAPNCMAVTNLAVTGATANSVTLSWTDALNTGATYSVYEVNVTGEVLVASGITTTSYTVNNLDALTSYTFGVVANCSANDASSMVTVNATTECASGNCNVYIYAQDSWGDGWNGAAISVMQGLTEMANYTMASQGMSSTMIYDTAMISVCAGTPITFNWTSGQYDGEISFDIANANGEIVATVESGSSLTSGETIFTLDSCNASAPTYSITIAVNDATMGTTNPAPGTYQYSDGDELSVTAVPNAGYAVYGWAISLNYQGTIFNDTLLSTDEDFENPLSFDVVSFIDGATLTALFATSGNDDCTVTLPYYETFDDELTCWTILDGDGDGYSWTHLFNGSIQSASYINNVGALTPNNWLISPQISLPAGGNYEVSWSASPLDLSYAAEHYGLYVSTTTMDTGAFTLLQQWTLSSNDTPAIPVVSLSSYAGQNIYLALRHWNCTDEYWMIIDNFTVREQPNANQVLVTVNPNSAYYGSANGGGVYSIGDNVAVTALPNSGCSFSSWNDATGNTVSTANPYTFVATTDVNLTAVFTDGTTPQNPDTAVVTIAINDATMGTVSPVPGTYQYPDDSTLTLTATPNTGYHFLYWNLDYYYGGTAYNQTFNTNPISFSELSAYSPLTITAIFEQDLNCTGTTCDLVVNGIDSWGDGWNGGVLQVMQNNVNVYNFTVDSTNATANIEVCSDYPVEFVWVSGSYASEVSFTVSTLSGTQLFEVNNASALVNGNVFATVTNPCTTPVVTFNHDTLNVTMAINDATMGAITPAPGTYQYLDTDTLTISATAYTGYHFAGWDVVFYNNGVADTTSFTDANLTFLCSDLVSNTPITFTANFEADTLAINCTGSTCYLTVDGTDSFGDGWNGSELLMYQNDTLIGIFTISDGNSYSQNFMVCSDYPVSFAWSAGNWADEAAFTVSNSYGELFNIPDGSMLSDTVFAYVSNVCSANPTVVVDIQVDSLTITLGVNNTTMGTTSPAPGTYQIDQYSTMTVTATPNNGYFFNGWAYSYNYEGTVYYDTAYGNEFNPLTIDGSYWFEVSPVSFIALFSSEAYVGDSMLVNIAVNNPAMGTTNPAPGAHYFQHGETASVIAIPNNGYQIEGWVVTVTHPDEGTVIDDTVYYAVEDVFSLFQEPIVVDDEMAQYVFNVTALFAPEGGSEESLTLITAVNNSQMGTMTPAPGEYHYYVGDAINFTATPYSGYYLESVSMSVSYMGMTFDTIFYGVDISDLAIDVEEDMLGYVVYVTANFAAAGQETAVLNVSVNNANMGYVLINGQQASTYNGHIGESVTLQAVANNGFDFVSWNDGSTASTRTVVLQSPVTNMTATFRQHTAIDVVGILDDLKVYPNPTYGALNINVDDVVKVEVLDINGRLVASFENTNKFDISELNAGTYMLRIQTTNGIATRKVVKK